MPEGEFVDEQPHVNSTEHKLESYFDRLNSRLTDPKSPPNYWNWERSKIYFSEALALQRNSPIGGYSKEGFDTVAEKQDYKSTLITDTGFDDYCRVFDYGKYGQGLQGKKILDLGAGKSLFGSIANYVYGNEGTQVVSLDPSYSNKTTVDELKEKTNKIAEENVVPSNRSPHLVSGLAQELPFPNDSFDEVVSQFGVTLVPPKDFPQAIREMYRVTKSRFQITPFISFVDITTLNLPKGVELKRGSLDGFTFVVNKNEASIDDVLNWLTTNSQGAERKVQLQATPDLLVRRKQGYYYKKEIDAWNDERPVKIDATGKIIPIPSS